MHNVFRGHAKHSIGDFNLGRMNERLAIKPHRPPLLAYGLKRCEIAKIQMYPVKYVEPGATRGQHTMLQRIGQIVT